MLQRINSFILFLLMALYAPLIFAMVTGMGYGGYVLTRMTIEAISVKHPRVIYLLVLAGSLDLAIIGASLLLLIGLLPLLFREVVPDGGGLPLFEGKHKSLFQLIERFSQRLRCRPPDAVFLTPTDTTAISDTSVMIDGEERSRRQRSLFLGAGHVIHLRADEFMTVLCHEMAHAAAGDTWFGRVVTRFFNSMSAAIGLQWNPEYESTWLERGLGWLLLGYFKLFAIFYLADSRRREYRADRMAAEICGPQNVRNALIKIHLADYIPSLRLDRMLVEYAMNEAEMPNVYSEYRRRWDELPASTIQKAENQMFMERPSIWATHPTLAHRIKNLSGIQAKELTVDKPATRLFSDWPRIEEHMTLMILGWGRKAYDQHINRLDLELRSNPR